MPTKTLNCYHGGRFFEAIGERFDDLSRRSQIVPADVLDAWFPPAPDVTAALQEHLEFLLRTSPPTQAEGLVATIAEMRGIDPTSIAVGAGSSDLIYRFYTRFLRSDSHVLILDPTYGEYRHVLENVVGCRITRFQLERDMDWHIDVERLIAEVGTGNYDLVVLVNPNNPTGVALPLTEMQDIADALPTQTDLWIDEAYLEYAAVGSMESYAATSRNVFVCKSLSKVYGLSGARAAYLVGPGRRIQEMRLLTPPWIVSLPAQAAAVNALQSLAYYQARWSETHALRESMAVTLAPHMPITRSCANWLLADVGNPGRTVEACRQEGVYLRDLTELSSQFRGKTIRMAVRSAEENERICDILLDSV